MQTLFRAWAKVVWTAPAPPQFAPDTLKALAQQVGKIDRGAYSMLS